MFNLCSVAKNVKLPILALGLKIHPAIATIPTPISVVFPIITEGWIAFTKVKSGTILIICW
jgi:hypothetical protein